MKFLRKIVLLITFSSITFSKSTSNIFAVYDYSYYKTTEPFKCAYCENKKGTIGIKYEIKSLNWEHSNYLVFYPAGRSDIKLCMKCAWKDAKNQTIRTFRDRSSLLFPWTPYCKLDKRKIEIDLPMAFPDASAGGTAVDESGKKIKKMKPGYTSCEICKQDGKKRMSLLKGNYYYFECPDCQKILCDLCNTKEKRDKINLIPNLCGGGPWCRQLRDAGRISAFGNKRQILLALETWWKNLATFLTSPPNAQDFLDYQVKERYFYF